MPRVKCISVQSHPGAPLDPILRKGAFYEVVNEKVETIASPDPFIEIRLPMGETIQRPRHLFGRILTKERL